MAETIPFSCLEHGPSGRARIVVYRRPVEIRTRDPEEMALLVHEAVVEEVANLLGLEPESGDPENRARAEPRSPSGLRPQGATPTMLLRTVGKATSTGAGRTGSTLRPSPERSTRAMYTGPVSSSTRSSRTA